MQQPVISAHNFMTRYYLAGLLMRPEYSDTKAETETRECETETETKKLL